MNNGHSVYFQLMNAGNLLATVSVRPMAIPDGVWAYEVRYVNQAPERGTIVASLDTEELQLVSQVLQSYFASHNHASVQS
jgi:hypothetical protein